MPRLFSATSIGVGGKGFIGNLPQPPAGGWTAQNSPLPGGFLQGVAFGNNTWVAIGNTGVVAQPRTLTSADGVNWALHVPVIAAGSFGGAGVYFTHNAFFTLDSNNALVRSVDGITWTVVAVPASFFQLPVAYNGAVYGITDAVAGNLTAWSSPDGIVWTKRTGNAGNPTLTNLVWGKGPGGGNFWQTIVTSGFNSVLAWIADITTVVWTVGAINTPAGAAVADDNGLLLTSFGLLNVGFNPIAVSIPAQDGWTQVNPPIGVGGGGGACVDPVKNDLCLFGTDAGNIPAASFSKDGGATWSAAQEMPGWAGFANSDGPVGFGNALYVAVSSKGEIATHPEL